ncbi:DUF3592 domain-containing protein [Variovorax sp. 770b2]|uniref:DUF3592 domain-containing protein n=1 Tax=Variovorax sp. 770b2 TaxID=1566271 RepID=UPI0008EE56CE|nr:DUF3592 domain-containing protein [Variovorax sp. 770b2]SFP44599.1 Protein of unknown function [Variovorax sp. 770b2]
MDDEAATHALLVFGLSLLVGPAIGALVGWRKTLFWGVGVGALLIGCAGLYGAATVGWQRHQSIAGTVLVEGRLVEFVEERSKDSKGRTTTTRAPVVEYTASDGQARRVKGLGGGLSDKSPDDPVDVRYKPADPSQALVADFQNMWGIVWALGLFGGFPTLSGIFFTGMAIKESRHRSGRGVVRTRTPAQQRWRTRGTVVANVVFLAGFALAFFYPDPNPMKQFGAGFFTIGVGALLHMVVQCLPPARDFEVLGILAIVGLGFAAFGYGAWMMA